MKIKINKKLKINIQFNISKINVVSFFVYIIFNSLIRGYNNEYKFTIVVSGECIIHIEEKSHLKTSYSAIGCINNANENNINCHITNSGSYTLTFENTLNSFKNMFKDCNGLTSITFDDYYADSQINDMSYMFANCSFLNVLDLTKFKFDNVINMSHMFEYCTNLRNIIFPTTFDTSKLINMEYMFSKPFY